MILTDTLKQKQEEHGETLVRLNSGIKVQYVIVISHQNQGCHQFTDTVISYSSGERGKDQEQLRHL